MGMELDTRCDYDKNATEGCVLGDVSKIYEAYTLLDLKKYLALHGVAQQSSCTVLIYAGDMEVRLID